jgi:hypothetical protein
MFTVERGYSYFHILCSMELVTIGQMTLILIILLLHHVQVPQPEGDVKDAKSKLYKL